MQSRGMIGKMCSGHRPPQMSIPAGSQIEYGGDEDLYITDALKESAARIIELEGENKRLKVALISCKTRAKARKLKHPDITWDRRFDSVERIATAALEAPDG